MNELTAEQMLDLIDRLRMRNAALAEIVREGRCPSDGRAKVSECQQCGCSLGILTKPIP